MSKDSVFLGSERRGSDFEFNSDGARVFDYMLLRSVPFYLEQQSMILNLAVKFFVPNTAVYDLAFQLEQL